MDFIKKLPKELQEYCYSFLSKLPYPSYVPHFQPIIKFYKDYYQYKDDNNIKHYLSSKSFFLKYYYTTQGVLFSSIKIDSKFLFYPVNYFEQNKINKLINSTIRGSFSYIRNIDQEDIGFETLYHMYPLFRSF